MKLSFIAFSWLLIAGLGGLSVFVYNVASLADDAVNSESKKKIKNIVKNYKSTSTFRHSFLTFTLASDVYFGEKIISLKSFLRSLALSLGWMVVITLVCIFIFPKYRSWFSEEGIYNLILEYGLLLLLSVVILDFISVSLTRLIVKKSKPNGIIKLFFVLAFDLFFSILIFYIGFSFAKYFIVNPVWLGFDTSLLVWVNLDQLPILLNTLNDLTSDMLQRQSDGTILIKGGWETEVVYAFPEGIAFYSSLLTSIWLWLHTISYVLMKISLSFDSGKGKLMSFFDIEGKPFKSLGIIVLILYAVLVLIIIAFGFVVSWFRGVW